MLLTSRDLSSLFRLFSFSVGRLGIDTGGELLVADNGDVLCVRHCGCVGVFVVCCLVWFAVGRCVWEGKPALLSVYLPGIYSLSRPT